MALTRHVNVADAIDAQDVPAFHQIADAILPVSSAQFLVLAATADLANERVFTPGAGLVATDGGAGGLYTLNVATADATIVINADSIQVGVIQNANIRNAAATSVIGRSVNSSGTVADIAASADLQFLRRSGGVLGFGAIVQGDLPALDPQFLTLATSTLLTNERVFTPSSGLTPVDGGAGSAYTLTNDVLTGKAGGQTWTGGTAASDPLTIRSTSNATRGVLTLDALTAVIEHSSDPKIHFKTSGTLRAGLRSDAGDDLHMFAGTSGYVALYVGGDGGSYTSSALFITGSGAVFINNMTGASSTVVKVSAAGQLSRGVAGTDFVDPGVNIIAGAGMTGGGDLSASRTLNVIAADGTITVNADSIQVGTIQTANIAGDAVTYAKIQNVTASRLLGRDSSGGDVQEITLGTNLSLSGTTLNAASTGAPTGAQYLTLATDAGLSAERVLVMSTGFTTSDGGANGNYTVTNQVFVGNSSANVTWVGSTASPGALVIESSSGTRGDMTLDAARVFSSNANTTASTANLVVYSTSSGAAQMPLHFMNNGSLRGGLRFDSGGNGVLFTSGGALLFAAGGDIGTGTEYMRVAAAAVSVSSAYLSINQASPLSTAYLDADVTGSRENVRFKVAGTTISDNGGRAYFQVFPRAGVTVGSGVVDASQIWTTMYLESTTFTAASGSPVTFAATTFYIANAPVAAGGLTITNPYAMWVDDGRSRFDGDSSGYVFELPDLDTVTAADPDKQLKVWVRGIGVRYIDLRQP